MPLSFKYALVQASDGYYPVETYDLWKPTVYWYNAINLNLCQGLQICAAKEGETIFSNVTCASSASSYITTNGKNRTVSTLIMNM